MTFVQCVVDKKYRGNFPHFVHIFFTPINAIFGTVFVITGVNWHPAMGFLDATNYPSGEPKRSVAVDCLSNPLLSGGSSMV